ncbi:MAG: hypothetical protein ACLGIN_06210 [Candidatus Sericytochromatia bacterium]
MRHLRSFAPWGAAAALLLLTACPYSPVGNNASYQIYPAPDESGQVTVTYNPPATVSPTEVTFLLELGGEDEAASAPSELDDSPDDGFTATFDASSLEFGMYFVSVFVDDEEFPSGRVAFVVPNPELVWGDGAAEEEATGEETTEE